MWKRDNFIGLLNAGENLVESVFISRGSVHIFEELWHDNVQIGMIKVFCSDDNAVWSGRHAFVNGSLQLI